MATEDDKPNLAAQLSGGQTGINWQKWSQLTALAWTDDKLKQRLIAKPTAVLQEHGITVPQGVEVRVLENTDKLYHLVLQAKPAGDVTELSSSQMAAVAGGVPAITICSPITINPSAPPLECITPLDPCRGKTIKTAL